MSTQETLPELVQPNPNYSLSSANVKQLTDELLSERVPETALEDERFITVELGPGSPFANIGRYIEGVVFQEAFKNDAQALAGAYLPYEDSSRFFVSFDRMESVPTGVLRVIGNSSAGLMTLNDAEKKPFGISKQSVVKEHDITDFDKVWDVGTVAVLPEHRHGQGPVSIQLFRAMYVSALNHDIEHLVSMVDDKLLKKLKGVLGIPFGPLAGSKPGLYMGSKKTHPVHGEVRNFYEKMSKLKESTRGRLLAKYAIGDSLERLVEGSKDDLIFLDK